MEEATLSGGYRRRMAASRFARPGDRHAILAGAAYRIRERLRRRVEQLQVIEAVAILAGIATIIAALPR